MDIFKDVPHGVEEIITNRMIASVVISPTGALIPVLDTAAIAGIWVNMIYEIAKYHHVTMTSEECTKIITACGAGVFGYLSGSKTINWLLNFIPGLGTLGAMAGNVVLNGYYTYAIGIAFHKMLKDYDINGRTVYEIARILVHLFVPIPSIGQLKEIFSIMKNKF